ncbi:hypothetical protein ACFX11_035816 [Malus domestica]
MRMLVVKEVSFQWSPIRAPLNMLREDHPSSRPPHSPSFNSSVSAVSFGFVATAILIFLFLVMAIFERFLRPTSLDLSLSGHCGGGDLEAHMGFNGKLSHYSPKILTELETAALRSLASIDHSRRIDMKLLQRWSCCCNCCRGR